MEVELDEALAAGLGDGALDSSRVAELSGRAADSSKAALGVRLGVSVVAPRAVPRSEGTAVRVVRR